MKPKGVLVVSNLANGDDTFTSDAGSWNVSRAQRDCAAGKHQLYLFDAAEVHSHNVLVEVDAAKVAQMVADPERLAKAPPLILIAENEFVWLIDGHHRLRALMQLGVKHVAGYVIEEADAKPYRVYFNGQRRAPWIKDK